MRSTSKITVALATFLFVSQAPADEFTANPDRALELIHETADRLGDDAVALAQAEVAYEYGQHPETAAAHMLVCLQAAAVTRTFAPVPAQRTAVTR